MAEEESGWMKSETRARMLGLLELVRAAPKAVKG